MLHLWGDCWQEPFIFFVRKPESWCWVVSKFSVGSERSFSFQENTILGGSLEKERTQFWKRKGHRIQDILFFRGSPTQSLVSESVWDRRDKTTPAVTLESYQRAAQYSVLQAPDFQVSRIHLHNLQCRLCRASAHFFASQRVQEPLLILRWLKILPYWT